MTERWELAARLAALHDRELDESGEADDGESEAVRQELAAADDDVLAAYAEAVVIARELREADLAERESARAVASEPIVIASTQHETDLSARESEPDTADSDTAGGTPVTPLRPRERAGGWRRPPARWMALAAVLAAVALVPLLRRAGSSPADAGRFAALLESRDAGVPEGWTYPWRVTRSGNVVAADTALAMQVGTYLLDLELAAHARDSEATADFARKIAALLAPAPASGPLVSIYRDIEQRAAEGPQQLEDLLEEGSEGVAGYFGAELVGLGSWIEAARLAAHGRDAAFFASRESRAVLGQLAESRSFDPAARAAVGRVSAAIPSGGAPNWEALTPALDDLMEVLGS